MTDWQDISTAPRDGTRCNLKFRDAAGSYEGKGVYFLHDEGKWIRIDPPTLVKARPTHWREAKPPKEMK